MKRLFYGFLAAFLMILPLAGLFAQQKYALVIGNGNYANITRLNNPVNDANDMEAALRGLGWTVDKVLNGNLTQMETGIVNLKDRLKGSKNSYGFFFYAGHGVQANGENYLIPVDANIQSESFLRRQAIAVQEMLDELNDAGNALNVVVLDACRDNPFPWKRSGSRGLQVVANQPADSIIVFATSAGSTAADGTGRNGLFTSHLLNNLNQPGLEVSEVFRRTGSDVSRASNRTQIPAIYNQFFETAYLGQRPTPNTPVQPPPQPAPAPTVQPAAPPVQPAPGNMVRIQGGTFTMGSPASEPSRESDEWPQRQVTVSSFYMGRTEVTQREYQEITGTNPSNFKGDNLPVENVSWYDAVEYCNKRSQKEGLTPAYIINKNQSDPNNTNSYDTVKWTVTWNRNANGYRLPTEAEWEYVCRAGTTMPFSTGNNITTSQANYNGDYPYNNNAKGTNREKTTPAGSFAPNSWGLYDMHGNVFEWCWDWFGNYTSGPQTDPLGASSGSYRVARGGSWYNDGGSVRSAGRYKYTPSYRLSYLGFRLVRPE